MSGPLVIYHGGCVDGFTAAWVFNKQLRQLGEKPEFFAAYYPPDGKPTELPDCTGRTVYMVDFCTSREQLLRIKEQAAEFMVLDHHKSARDACAGLDFCVFDMEQSGAGLAWRFFRGASDPPWLVAYVEDRDLWRFALPDSKAVNAYVATREFSFESWEDLQRGGANTALARGGAVLQYINQYVSKMAAQAIRQSFAGYDDIPVVNAPFPAISEVVGKLAEDATFAVGWSLNADGKLHYSLRSRGGFDVSEVAKKFGGGGHAAAAGFTVSERVS